MVRILVASFWFVALLAVTGAPALPQDPPNPASSGQGDFFSGFIVSSSAAEITVNRKGLGKDTAATRTFAIDAGTKIEGVLKPKAHVTVRFVGDENSARAVHIIVR